MSQAAPEYKVGDKVEYHAIGGASPNVASSTGEITDIRDGEEKKYGIKNVKTKKTTYYQGKNITGKIDTA